MAYEKRDCTAKLTFESQISHEQLTHTISLAEEYLNKILLSEYNRTAGKLQYKFYHNSVENPTRHMSDCLSSFQRIAEGLLRNNKSIGLTCEDVLVHVCAILYHDIVHNYTNVEGQSNEELSAHKADQSSIIAFLDFYGIHFEDGAELTKFINRVHKIIIGTTAIFESKKISYINAEYEGVEISNKGITNIQQALDTDESEDEVRQNKMDAVLTLAWDFGRVAMINNGNGLLRYLNESLRCGIEVQVTVKILAAYEAVKSRDYEFDLNSTLASPDFEFYSAIQQFLAFCKDEKNAKGRKEKADKLFNTHKSSICTLMTSWFSSQFAFTKGVFDILENKELFDDRLGLLSYIQGDEITQEQLFNVYEHLARDDTYFQFTWFIFILSVNNHCLSSLSALTQLQKELAQIS